MVSGEGDWIACEQGAGSLSSAAPAASQLDATTTGDEVGAVVGEHSAAAKGGLKAVLEGMGDLWDEAQYKEEFSLDAFMKKL